MTQTYNIGGPGGTVRSILRLIIAAAAVIGGLLLMAASAAVAFFLLLGIVILAALAIAFMWGKAKLTGKPFGPKAYFKAQGFDFDAAAEKAGPQFQTKAQAENPPKDPAKHGPIIDAHETPDGWSVDD